MKLRSYPSLSGQAQAEHAFGVPVLAIFFCGNVSVLEELELTPGHFRGKHLLDLGSEKAGRITALCMETDQT